MSLTEHLEDLRRAVVRICIILTVSFFVTYAIGGEISEFLLVPLRKSLNPSAGDQVVYLGILDKVLSQLQVSFWTSILLSSPVWFYQIWNFVKPGLHAHEIKAVRPFLLVGFFLFWCGVFFGYYVVFPVTVATLLDFGVQNVAANIALKDYLVLTSQILVFLGLIFQVPNILLILGFMGLVTKYSLREMRRYVYVGLSIFAAVITPPDVITMMALWIPLVILYEVGVVAVALIVHPYLAKQHG